ncbi:MAG: DUF928 domain-containing protein [Actinomycetota bacterium]
MARKQLFNPLTLFSVALSLELALVSSLPIQAQAQSKPGSSNPTTSTRANVRVTFDPPGSGKPRETAGGASRGVQCPQEQASLGGCVTLLVPTTQEGLTVADRPAFFAYLPKTDAKQVFFSLVDESKNTVYQTKMPLQATGGIVSFKLPADAPALEIGKNYQWSLIVIGSQGLRPDSPAVQGWVRRVELNATLKNQLEQATLLERAALYGQQGLWFDALESLAMVRQSQPSDSSLATNWQELLTSVGLDAVANKPLLQ